MLLGFSNAFVLYDLYTVITENVKVTINLVKKRNPAFKYDYIVSLFVPYFISKILLNYVNDE